MNDSEIIKRHYRKIGAMGGKAGQGVAKARTTEQARSAANKRWSRRGKVPKKNRPGIR